MDDTITKQFNTYYGQGGMSRYEPGFIVKTDNGVFMIETKASNKLKNKNVIEKAKAAKEYCIAVSEWNAENEGKPWTYVLISHDEVRLNSSFKYLVVNRVQYEQIEI